MAVVIAALGFLSNSSYLFSKIQVSENEQKQFYKKIKSFDKRKMLDEMYPKGYRTPSLKNGKNLINDFSI